MSSKKEEERNEKIIRGLMKLPPNRRCINCNSVGPQYVCTNFWTFVCMTCSGIHREFTHRVKSVSMSKFTSQEVEALQEGGNQRARETFFTHLDPRGQRLPDNSNADKVREFIKSVYVDKKFCAAKTSGKPPRDTLNLRNNEDETRRASSYHSYSQSPPYDYQYEERRYGKQAPELTKKPGSDRGFFRFSSSSRLSDHAQDRFANEVPSARNSDYSASSGGVPFRSGTQSPTSERVFNFSSPSSETSRDNLSEDVQQHSVETLLNLKPDLDQTTGSSGSIKPLSSDDVDFFSAPSAPQTNTSAPLATDLFQSSVSSSALPVNNLQPRNNSTALTSSVNQQSKASSLDLFSDTVQKQFSETLKDKSPDTVIQKNEGWATFDMPWHVENPNPVSGTSTSNESQEKFDQAISTDASSDWSLHLDFSANGPSSSLQNPWHEGLHNTGALPSVDNQSWSSFENSTTPFQRFHAQSSEQVPVRDQSVADPYLGWGILEGSKTKVDLDSQPHILSTTPHASESRASSRELPVVDGALSFGLNRTFSNPFDLPSDSDIPSSNMFMEMSSLQSALPNHNISTPWLTGNTAIPFAPDSSQDALVFLAGQAPSREIPNIPTQGPLASIGGNPFA